MYISETNWRINMPSLKGGEWRVHEIKVPICNFLQNEFIYVEYNECTFTIERSSAM